MPNSYFKFKHFVVYQNRCAMKVCTDSCLFGAWAATKIYSTAKNILDIGTGTGLLSLMLQQKLPFVTILGIDVDENSVAQAKQNTKHFFNISIQKTNVLRLDESKKFDAIICNPPFYEQQLKSPNSNKNLAHHAIELSHKDLAYKIANLLGENGQAFVLLPFSNYKNFIAFAANEGLYMQQMALLKQTTNHSFFRVMLEFKLLKTQEAQEEIVCIKDAENNYTKEFIGYLKEYYLNF